ncbi:MAG: winged helix-turn-helix transcriptional regulator [Candidatus Aenigmatarchaeota archaeon]
MIKNFLGKKDEEISVEDIIKRLDTQYAHLAMEFEKFKILNEKIEKLNSKIMEIEEMISRGIKFQSRSVSTKTKDAIKLILKKYGELTSEQLSKVLKLSRTRCNEYLKEMEEEGITKSRIVCRKKLYSLRQ